MDPETKAASAALQVATGGSSGSPPLPSFVQRLVPDFLSNNPYFCAGFGLAGLGAAASLARGAVRGLKVMGRRRLLTSLEVPIRDPAYPWVMQWLIARGNCSLHLGVETTYAKDAAGNVEAVFNFVPSPGQHVLRYKDAFLWIDRQRSGEVVDFSSGSPWETLTLTTLSLHKHRITELHKRPFTRQRPFVSTPSTPRLLLPSAVFARIPLFFLRRVARLSAAQRGA
ncbi:mitochondrial related protein [Cyclospora cayetanensis]|uniref:Mitochondrial related protein n=1 Tax=Cyclospora cayetanensis TaxID=88456 RepID=A0A1D3CVX0_9EIME|nr:mitochondrial related protein [Cyclospora cayetanensis]